MASKNRKTAAKRKAANKKKTHKKSARAIAKEKSAGEQIKAAREAARTEMAQRRDRCGKEIDLILRKYDCTFYPYPEFEQSAIGDGSWVIKAAVTIVARNTKEEAEEG